MKRGTPRHPKVSALAAELKIKQWGAVGLLEMLWHFTSEFARAGDIGRYSDDAIASALYWDRTSIELVSSLVATEFLEKCPCHRLRVHDWKDHADQTVRRALVNANETFLPCYDQASSELSLNARETARPGLGVQGECEGEKVRCWSPESRTLLHILNEGSGYHYRETDTNLRPIQARLDSPGVTFDEAEKVVLRQCAVWKGTDMAKFLRPETLFGKEKFEAYWAQRDAPLSQKPVNKGY